MTLLENGKLTTGYKDQKKTLKVDDEGRKYVENKVREEEIRVLEFKEALAETKAYTRLVRALLALKGYYTKEELKRPFIVVKISLNIHYLLSNESMKQQLVTYALASQNAMFGLPPSMEVHHSTQLPAHVEMSDAIIDDSPDNTDASATLQTELIQPSQPELKKELGNPMTDAPLQDVIDSFKLAKLEERLASIKQWIERKGYTPKPGLPKPEDMTVEEQVSYLTHLYNLKDKERVLKFD